MVIMMMIMMILIISNNHNNNNVNVIINRTLHLKHIREAYRRRKNTKSKSTERGRIGGAFLFSFFCLVFFLTVLYLFNISISFFNLFRLLFNMNIYKKEREIDFLKNPYK